MRARLAFAIAGLFLCAACDDAPGSSADAGDPADAGPDAGPPGPYDGIAVEWAPCSFVPGADDGLGECALVTVPLAWAEPDGPTFQTAVKRRRATVPAEGQLWFLHGGPGGSGTIAMPPMMNAVQAAYPALDVYTLDARGTGDSDFLACPQQESYLSSSGPTIDVSELDACIGHVNETWGERLGSYNVTNAALDLAALIHATRQPGVRVLIWGGSGGTYWAQRYLQLEPAQVDAVVLEGIAGPQASLATQDEFDEKMVREVFRRCGEDAACAAKVPDPLALVVDLGARLDAGHCAALRVNGDTFKTLLYAFAYYAPYNAVLPALLYRLDRCSSADVAALGRLLQRLFRAQPERSFSLVLFMHQVSSEMWLAPGLPTAEAVASYLDGVYAEAVIASGKGYLRHETFLRWPKYTDPLDDGWAASEVPMLMLQGELDPSTPFAEAVPVGAHFSGSHQHFVSFPYAAHNVRSGTPTRPDVAAPAHCGDQLFIAFLHDPTAPVDTSCVAATLPLDFVGTVYAPLLLGTVDYFENEAAPQTVRAALDETVTALAAELARRGARGAAVDLR